MPELQWHIRQFFQIVVDGHHSLTGAITRTFSTYKAIVFSVYSSRILKTDRYVVAVCAGTLYAKADIMYVIELKIYVQLAEIN